MWIDIVVIVEFWHLSEEAGVDPEKNVMYCIRGVTLYI
jgi:hypothetical protein